MKLIIDVMGSDVSPNEAIKACRTFKKNNPDIEFTLVGKENEIKQFIKPRDGFNVVNAEEVVHTEENFLQTLRNDKTSMHKALAMVANGEGDGILSAGSSAAYVVLANMIVKAIPGVSKPAFMSYFPTINKKGTLVLDVGANINCDAQDLVSFAKMADVYSKNIRKIPNPLVYILNNGTEKNKGFAYHQEADKILTADSSINYKGFIEAKLILSGEADVVVTDGYAGNMVLKSVEGALKNIKDEMKNQYRKPWNFIGALASLGMVFGLKRTFNYEDNAAAFVLGLNKVVVKTHGASEYREWIGALGKLKSAVDNNLVENIKKQFNL